MFMNVGYFVLWLLIFPSNCENMRRQKKRQVINFLVSVESSRVQCTNINSSIFNWKRTPQSTAMRKDRRRWWCWWWRRVRRFSFFVQFHQFHPVLFSFFFFYFTRFAFGPYIFLLSCRDNSHPQKLNSLHAVVRKNLDWHCQSEYVRRAVWHE